MRRGIFTVVCAITFALTFAHAGQAATPPQQPQAVVSTTFPTATGQTIFVPSGGDLQAAIDSAQPGDVVTLQAGATYTGNFTLPAKSGTGYVIIRTSTPDNQLPPQGTRITPDKADLLAKVVTPNSNPALATADGANHYWILGVEFEYGGSDSTEDNGLVQFGSSTQSDSASVPHDLVIDRCYIHGSAPRYGLTLNSAASAVVDSSVDARLSAIGAWNGPGPFKVENNELDAAGQNVRFGGPPPTLTNVVPSDITITHNLLKGRSGQPFEALLRLDNAQRVFVDGNVFEDSWLQDTETAAIVFDPDQTGSGGSWVVVKDVTVTHNVIQQVGAGVRFTARSLSAPDQERLLVQDNLFVNVGEPWTGNDDVGNPNPAMAIPFSVSTGGDNIAINHNTVLQQYPAAPMTLSQAADLVFTNNIVENGNWQGQSQPASTNRVIQANAFIGGQASNPYPPGNFFPADDASVGFTDEANGDYSLTSSSPYHSAGTDGRDLGVDWAALQKAVTGASNGTGGETGTSGDSGGGSSSLAQPIVWTNLVNATASGDSLEKTGGCDGCDDAGGVSQQQIASGTGTFTFTAQPGSTTSLAFDAGLAHATSTPPLSGDIDYAFEIWGNGEWVVHEHGAYVTDGTYSAGDTFSIAIEAGPVVKYYHNSTLVYTSTTAPTSYPYAAAGSFYAVRSTAASATLQASSGTGNGGTGTGGSTTGGGDTSGGGTTGGSGGSTTGGTGGSTSSQAVAWIHLVQATATGGSLEKTAGCDGCDDAGGVSQQQIASGTGSFTFSAQPGSTTSLAFYAGLTHSTSTAPSDSAIDYGFSIWGNGGWEVREGGVYKTDGTYRAGDTFSVAIEAGPVVKYYHNGTLVYTSVKVPASYPYAGAGALYAIDSTVADAAIQTSSSSDTSGGGGTTTGGSGGTTTGGGSTTGGGTDSGGAQAQDIVWTNLVQATPTGDSLQKTSGCDGCDDAGGVSQQQIASGTGAFAFAAQPGSTTSLAFYAGLTHTTSTPPSDSSIDYGFSIWAGGAWEVREDGVYKTDGAYNPGDTFTVSMEAGVVKYYHNGALVYTSATAPTSSVYVAAGSLYAIGSTVANATLSKTP